MYSYAGLLAKLQTRGLTKTALGQELGISSRTLAKMGRGERVAQHVLARIAAFLNCPVDQLCRPLAANPLLQLLREEKAGRLAGGLYHELQVRLTFNSNHMEGSKLSEEQTRLIFSTHTIAGGQAASVDDIIETVNHFRAIDYVLDWAEAPLREDLIKELHRLLKQGTADAALPWFALGDYKRRPNLVGGWETTAPAAVPASMKALLRSYEGLPQVSLEDIVRFHYRFECIHPFQDGNGRVGRLIALKECLRHSILPFLIEDEKKFFYYRGLALYPEEEGYLTATCMDGQDCFKRLLAQLGLTEAGTEKQ